MVAPLPSAAQISRPLPLSVVLSLCGASCFLLAVVVWFVTKHYRQSFALHSRFLQLR